MSASVVMTGEPWSVAASLIRPALAYDWDESIAIVTGSARRLAKHSTGE